MFEFHGRAVIRCSSARIADYLRERAIQQPNLTLSRLDAESRLSYELFDNLEVQIESLPEKLRRYFHLQKYTNDHLALTVSGLRNHREIEVFKLFEWLGVNGDQSYGFLFTRDDEDADRDYDYETRFRVFRLSHGRLEELETLLPVI